MHGRATAVVLIGLSGVLGTAGCTGPAPVPPTTPSASASWPMVPGRVLATSEAYGERFVTVAVTDPEQAFARARSLLVRAGFVLTKDREATGGGDGQACTTALCVQFSATTDPEYGPSVAYEAFHSTGPVAG